MLMNRFLYVLLCCCGLTHAYGQNLSLSLDSLFDARCHGTSSGSVYATASGGIGPYVFHISTDTVSYPSGTFFEVFPVGDHFLAVTDALGARDTLFFAISEPAAFLFSFQTQPLLCFGGANGTASVSVSGGTSPYTFQWDNGDSGNLADSLVGGLHFVTVTDAQGCMAASVTSVGEPTMVMVDSFVFSPVSCFGGNDGFLTVFSSGGTGPYGFMWSDSQTTATATALSAGLMSVTVTDNNGCSGSNTAFVDQPPQLAVFLQNSTAATCVGRCDGSATLAVQGGTPGYTIDWMGANAPFNALMSDSLCAGVVQVVVADFFQCTASLSFTIGQPDTLRADFQLTPPVCAGQNNGAAVVNVTGGLGAYQISWSNGQNGASASNLPCGPLGITVVDAANCAAVFSDSLPCVSPLLSSTVDAVPVRCFGESNGQLSVSPSGGQMPLNYAWNDANQQNAPTASSLPAGVYSVTVTDAFGCTATASGEVFQPLPLTATIGAGPIRCVGEVNGTAYVNAVGGNAPYQYTWNNNLNGDTIGGLAVGNYFATVTDSKGCTTVSTVASVGQPADAVKVVAQQTVTGCYGSSQSGAALAEATGGNGAPFTYLWSNNQSGGEASNLAAGAYSVTASDAKGCTSVASVEVVTWDSIRLNVIFTKPGCYGASDGRAAVNLIDGGAGMGDTLLYTYQWSIPDQPGTLLINGLSGSQTYGLTVSDVQGCSDSTSFFIPDPSPLNVTAYAEAAKCAGDSSGSAGVLSAQGDYPIVEYRWSTGASTPVLNGLPTGAYSITVVDSKGCESDTLVQVDEPQPLAIDFTVKPLLCFQGQSASINAKINGGTPAYRFNWSNGDTSGAIQNLSSGLYVLTLTDANSCVLTDTVVIEDPSAAAINLIAETPLCTDSRNGRITAEVTGVPPLLRFSLDGQTYGPSNVFIGLRGGLYTVWVKDGNGCIFKDTVTVPTPLPVLVSLGADTTILIGDSLLLIPEVENAFAPIVFEWQTVLVEETACPDAPECSMLWVKPLYDNTYRVTVTDANGCSSETEVRVAVQQPNGVFVPTGFSPNGDFNNDLLLVHAQSRGVVEISRFSVYDRWGEEVYSDHHFPANDPTRGWDGTFRGQPCDPGVFGWWLEVEYADGQFNTITGNTTLIR